jgi:hypothetical protein
MERCNYHGGKREGAGRKASGKVGKSYYLTLSQEATEKLKSIGRGKSAYIDRLILVDIGVSDTPQIGQRVQVNVPGRGWLDGEYIGCKIDAGVGRGAFITHNVQLDRGWSVTFRNDEIEMRVIR